LALRAREFVIVVAKLGSFPNAVASSPNVSKTAGDELTKLAIAALTEAGVAKVELGITPTIPAVAPVPKRLLAGNVPGNPATTPQLVPPKLNRIRL
jgi:hypothetical protein